VSRVASARPPDPRSDDDGVSTVIRRGGATPETAAWRRNPKGWADLLRRAALLVVGVALLRLRLLLAPCAAGNSAQRGHGGF